MRCEELRWDLGGSGGTWGARVGHGGLGVAAAALFSPQNRGIYMFRINNEHVIDATLTGGPAR